VTALARRLEDLRAFLVELGPLRPVALATAVLPTIGMMLVLASLATVDEVWPPSWSGLLLAFGTIAVVTGAVLLPPGIAALAAGYCLGAACGVSAAVLGVATGGVVGQRLVWPLLGARLFAFMRARPRVHQVQRLCAGAFGAQVRGVMQLRAAAQFPFPVTSLLLSAAATPSPVVWLGSALGVLPQVWLAGVAGEAFRAWRKSGQWPSAWVLANVALAIVALALLLRWGRRAWQQSRPPV
jgi:hypothetical protein